MSLLEAGRLTTELSHRQQHRLEETEQGDLRSLAPAAALGLPFLRGPFVPALSFTSVHTGSVRSSSQAGVYSPASSPPLLQCTHSFVCQADPTSTARPSPACGRRPCLVPCVTPALLVKSHGPSCAHEGSQQFKKLGVAHLDPIFPRSLPSSLRSGPWVDLGGLLREAHLEGHLLPLMVSVRSMRPPVLALSRDVLSPLGSVSDHP